ncbi:MAG: FliA/WhiG family RNA polymerase sigma factor [Bacillota bacterium]|jgi:RNA polymerase sigma factor for flagellar operon FliA
MSVAELWSLYSRTKSEEIKQELVLHYLGLVKYQTGRLAIRLPACINQEDLESCGIIGLMEAVGKFDPGLGVDFEAYAARRIRGAMLDEIRRVNWVPRSTWQKMQRLTEARERLEKKTGGHVTEEQLALEQGIGVDEVHRISAHLHRAFNMSLDEVAHSGNGDAVCLTELLEDPSSPDPLQSLAEVDERACLARAVDSLDERDRLLLALYYQEGLTLKEIGSVLEVSESRVCQLHSRALTRLRKLLA